MTHYRATLRGQYGSHQADIAADTAMAHRIHASMQRVQAAVGDTMPDGTGTNPDLKQLGAGEQAVLAMVPGMPPGP